MTNISWVLVPVLLAVVQLQNQLVSARLEDRRAAISLGIRMHDGRMGVLVARNTALPAKVSKRFSHGSVVEILAGDHPVAKDNFRLGLLELNINGLSGNVRLSFDIDITGLLTVTVEDEQSGNMSKRSFEEFRDIHNVLASVESWGSWNVLTALADKSPTSSQRNILTRLQPMASAAEPKASLASAVQPESSARMVQNQEMGPFSWLPLPLVAVALTALVGAVLIHHGCPPSELLGRFGSRTASKVSDAALASQTKHEQEGPTVEKLQMELRVSRLLLVQQREELEACQQLTNDLPFVVYDEDKGRGKCDGQLSSHASSRMRFVKIQCPGVTIAGIEIEIAVNGVVVKIERDKSPGMSKLNWRKKFQFPQEEGHFEFKEEEVRLELGVLLLPFKSYTPQPRLFRLPRFHPSGASHSVGSSDQSSSPPVIAEGSASWVLAASQSSCAPTEDHFLTLLPQSEQAAEESFLTPSLQSMPQSSEADSQRLVLLGEGSDELSTLAGSSPSLTTTQAPGILSADSSLVANSPNFTPLAQASSLSAEAYSSSMADSRNPSRLGESPPSSSMMESLRSVLAEAPDDWQEPSPLEQGSSTVTVPPAGVLADSLYQSIPPFGEVLPALGPGLLSSLPTDSSRSHSQGYSSEGSSP